MDVFGIRKEGEHWRCFDENGDMPGYFADAEAARWGCWAEAQDVDLVNAAENRAMTMDDMRAAIRRRMPAPPTVGEWGCQPCMSRLQGNPNNRG